MPRRSTHATSAPWTACSARTSSTTARRAVEPASARPCFLDAFSDLGNEIVLMVAEGDLVAAHQRWRGTHDGEFLGVEPTARRVEFTSTAVLRVRDGLIAEAWDEVDMLSVLQQLGVLPST